MGRPIVARIAGTLLALLIAAAVGGCGTSAQTTGADGATAATAAPTPTAGATTTSEPAVLVDGRHPVFLKTVDPNGQTITFDLVQFYTGQAAATAAAEDHQESPPPNDTTSAT